MSNDLREVMMPVPLTPETMGLVSRVIDLDLADDIAKINNDHKPVGSMIIVMMSDVDVERRHGSHVFKVCAVFAGDLYAHFANEMISAERARFRQTRFRQIVLFEGKLSSIVEFEPVEPVERPNAGA